MDGNYITRRVVQESGVWLLAASSRLWHTTSVDNVASREVRYVVEVLFKSYALPMSNGTFPGAQEQQSRLLVRKVDDREFFRNFTDAWIIRRRKLGSFVLSVSTMFTLLLAYAYMLVDRLNDFHRLILLLSEWSNKQLLPDLDQTMLECFAKLDLLHVLHFRAPPLFGSAFARTMQPPGPEMVRDVAIARAGSPGASTSAP